MVAVIKEIREQAPGTGAYKLFLMLKSTFADKMVGRDKFYKLMRTHQLMLPPMRRRHTTNSNHNYRKYKNLVKGFALQDLTNFGLQTLPMWTQMRVFATFI